MKEIEILKKAAREIYLFLWQLKIKINIMPQTEYVKMLDKLTAEQKIYAKDIADMLADTTEKFCKDYPFY